MASALSVPLCSTSFRTLPKRASSSSLRKRSPAALGKVFDVPARVRAVRPKSPSLGEIEHLRQESEHSVGSRRGLAESMVQGRDILSRHRRQAKCSEMRKNMESEVQPVVAQRRRLLLELRVLSKETLGQVGHCDRLRCRPNLDRGVASIARFGEKLRGLAPSLVGGERAVRAESQPTRSSLRSVLDDVVAASTRSHAKPESRKLGIPKEALAIFGSGSIYDSLGQLLRHDPSAAWFEGGSSVEAPRRETRRTAAEAIVWLCV